MVTVYLISGFQCRMKRGMTFGDTILVITPVPSSRMPASRLPAYPRPHQGLPAPKRKETAEPRGSTVSSVLIQNKCGWFGKSL